MEFVVSLKIGIGQTRPGKLLKDSIFSGRKTEPAPSLQTPVLLVDERLACMCMPQRVRCYPDWKEGNKSQSESIDSIWQANG
jgi:hypothetical protein